MEIKFYHFVWNLGKSGPLALQTLLQLLQPLLSTQSTVLMQVEDVNFVGSSLGVITD